MLLTRLAFKHTGISHRLVVVSDGEQAVRYLNGEGPYADREQFPIPRLILLDLEMPRMTGFEFLAWLRQESEIRHLPVIVLSGSLNSADLRHAYQAGANCFLAKPTDLTEFAATLTQMCDFWLKRCTLPDASTNANLTIKEKKPNLSTSHTDTGEMAA